MAEAESISPPSSVEPVARSAEVNNEDSAVVEWQGWTPKALRKSTLVLLALLFAVIAFAIGALYVVSRLNDGLCDAKSRDHYAWTYAPTASFTLVAAIWNQVEFRTLQMQPWRALAEGRKEASQSVLLDYISSWNVIVLLKAIKRRQVVVGAAVSASLLLKILIVLSTGLLTLSEVQRTQSGTTLAVKDRFLSQGSQFDPNEVDARPAALVLAYGQTNLEHPIGTTLDEAYQRFLHHMILVQELSLVRPRLRFCPPRWIANP